MPVKIRLARRGRSKRPFYHIIVADSRSPRDGKYIEKLGIYDPLTTPATIDIKHDRALHWLTQGAQPTDTARAILSYTGVLYKKHLQRGVTKGALIQEQADAKFMDWWDAKRAKVEDHKNRVQAEKDQLAGDRKAAESKIRAEKAASQQAALAPEGASSESSAGVTAEPTGDAIADALNTAQTDNEALLGISKDAPAEEKPAEKAAEAPAEQVEAAAPAAEPEVKEEVKEEAPAVVEEVQAAAPAAVAEAVKEEVAPVVAEKPATDDLKKIEGVGPKLAEVLNAGGINTFADLAGKSADEVKTVLENAEGNFAMHDPTTWPKQAALAADGKWDDLKALQDELDGGKVTT